METNVFGIKTSRKGIVIEKLYLNPEDLENTPENSNNPKPPNLDF